jgi:Ca-activated chloride channel homolog
MFNRIRMQSGWMSLCVAWAMMFLLTGCSEEQPSSSNQAATESRTSTEKTVELIFPYGSEKKAWLDEATAQFNAMRVKTADGSVVQVKATAMGSGEQMTEVLEGRLQADLVSPASGLFIELANAQSRTKTGQDVVGKSQSLVLSPVVIAMWKPMAQALGWPEKPIGWQTIFDMSSGKITWAQLGHPEWGEFKFGHTHPEFSNSGLISICAKVYAGAGKTRDLTLEDVANPKVAAFVEQIEKSVVHYGSSTGFFGNKMFERGPGFLSAAVLYENMVVESYGGVGGKTYNLPFPVVSIYPSEGTFWSDHPVAIVNREWVTDTRKEAAGKYIEFLLAKEQQQAALKFGFRPGDVSVPLASPIDMQHGVDPAEPRTTLAVPPANVTNAIIELWRKHKKHSRIILLLDTSGSMREENRIANAKTGAADLVNMLGNYDTLSVVSFNNRVSTIVPATVLEQGRSTSLRAVEGLFADGGTALYDAIAKAHADLSQQPDDSKISALVVLSDGEDRNSQLKLEQLLEQIKSTGEQKSIRIFTIGYGEGADMKVLENISKTTDGKAYKGTNKNIREIFKDIATFF